MKKIALTQGRYAIVDAEDFEELSKYKWHAWKGFNTYYAIRTIRGGAIRMHRQVLGLTKGDDKLTDHIDRNGLNNRRHNIRLATHTQNQQNQQSQRGKSKYKGVSWCANRNKWRAQIRLNKKDIRLGRFTNEIEAAKSYDCKAKELFGEFANPNF